MLASQGRFDFHIDLKELLDAADKAIAEQEAELEMSTELVDAEVLASRWRVPESWIRSHTRARTPQGERIPCVRLGRYVRFEWGSAALEAWLAAHRKQ